MDLGKTAGLATGKLHAEEIKSFSEYMVADFETSRTFRNDPKNPNSTWVWGWSAVKVSSNAEFKDVSFGNSIASFIETIMDAKNRTKVVFLHNLSFDGKFITSYLKKKGWGEGFSQKMRDSKKFFVQMAGAQICFIDLRLGKKLVRIIDSNKILTMPVSKMSEKFGLSDKKLELDYMTFRSEGQYESEIRTDNLLREMTEEKVKRYMANDVIIVSRALASLNAMDLLISEKKTTYLTVGGIAINEFKRNNPMWKRLFPQDCDVLYDFCSGAYMAGLGFIHPNLVGGDVVVHNGVAADVNAMYPAIARQFPMPYGLAYSINKFSDIFRRPDRFGYVNGEFYIAEVKLYYDIRMKYGLLPSFRSRGFNNQDDSDAYVIELWRTMRHLPSDKIERDDLGEFIRVHLCGQDLAILNRDYEGTWTLEGGYMWSTRDDLFTSHFDKWQGIKAAARLEGDAAKETTAKMVMNNTIGKFGSRHKSLKHSMVYEDGKSKVKCDGVGQNAFTWSFIAVPVCVNALGRLILSELMQHFNGHTCYTAVDSLWLANMTVDEFCDEIERIDMPFNFNKVNRTDLGAWKVEAFKDAKFINRNQYAYVDFDDNVHLKWSGVPKRYLDGISFEDFKPGLKVDVLVPTDVNGGVILEPGTMELHDPRGKYVKKERKEKKKK